MYPMLVEHLRREHDERAEEYRELAKLLPNGIERVAIKAAITALADSGKPLVAACLSSWLHRLHAAQR